MKQTQLKKFLALPVNEKEIWQGGFVSFADLTGLTSVPGQGDFEELGLNVGKMSMALLTSVTTGLIHATPIKDRDHRADDLLDVILEFCTEQDFPFRPGRIECNDEEMIGPLQRAFVGADTDIAYVPRMSDWENVVADMKEHLGGIAQPVPTLFDSGCSLKQIREFAIAAADFYQVALWQYLDDIDLIDIKAPKAPVGLRHAVVLGAAGEAYGLGMYSDPEDHYCLMSQKVDPRQLSLFSLTFGDRLKTPQNEVDFWRKHDLPLAGSEAYPFPSFYSPEGVRRPTGRELGFVTRVLLGLAATSETEIDSGAWEKEIQYQGKRSKIGFAIPNLVDPPDRQEWIRRGLMPEFRSNERQMQLVQQFILGHAGEMSMDDLNAAINAKFTGPIDEIEYPTDTPAERAAALTWQAIDTFGRRRLILARQAIAEDPAHVEANLLVAEMTHSTNERIERFRAARDYGRLQLGRDFEGMAGHFWGFHETRPYMRACEGLAGSLAADGQVNEAIEQYREMLELNPNDNQGVRYRIVPLLISQNRDPEALEILNRYEEQSATWLYSMSLLEFRKSGESLASKKAIRAAFRFNPHLIESLQSTEPPLMPDSYALGSIEEAATVLAELEDALAENVVFVDWMIREFFLWEKEKQKRLRDQKRKAQKRKSTKRKRNRR